MELRAGMVVAFRRSTEAYRMGCRTATVVCTGLTAEEFLRLEEMPPDGSVLGVPPERLRQVQDAIRAIVRPGVLRKKAAIIEVHPCPLLPTGAYAAVKPELLEVLGGGRPPAD